MADSLRRRSARDQPALSHRMRRQVRALRARRPAGAPVGDPRHAWAGAPDRGTGEGRQDRRDLLRRSQPPAHDRPARGQGGGHRGAGRRDPRRGRRRPAGAGLGLVVRDDPRGSAAGARTRRARRHGASSSPQPDAGQPRRGAALLRARARPGDELGSARPRAARQLPGRRRVLREGSGAAAAAVGDGAGDMAATELSKADFQSDQETRWCPGCGDYAVLAAVQGFFPELGIPPERVVFVSGIGCAGRFAYYMDTYGMHGIHGRGPALATGLAAAREDLSIWVVTGDGDALSIGGNHLIHALRRNVPVKILLFNNQIYGLTKGQASPTSERGKVTKSTPFGSIDAPFNPVSLALGAEASFVARTIDTDKRHLPAMLRAAAEHEGAALVEIYQNCPVFNDGAFDALRDKKQGAVNRIPLQHGQPIRFGAENENGVVRGPDGDLRIAPISEAGEAALVVHDAHREDPSLAFALSR